VESGYTRGVRLVVVVAVCWVCLAAARIAHAQAPGEVAPVPPAPVTAPGVMANRWAATLGLAPESVTAQTSGAQPVGLTTVEIAARYRIWPWLETGIAVFAGGANSGQLVKTSGVYADVRYRFVPERKWNGFVSLGVGAVKLAQTTASSVDQNSRGSFRIGLGGERRFGGLGLGVELRLIGIAQNTQASNMAASQAADDLARYGVGGLELVLGATYYF
jgi:hypothetical protein